MKELLLLRHGKSDWDVDYGGDHERPLAARGRSSAKLIGRFLEQVNSTPDLVVTSSAVRALETARRAAEAGAWKHRLLATEALYGASPLEVVDLIAQQTPDVGRLMLVGHNPTWEETASLLIGGGLIRLPTAAVACLRLSVSTWSDVAPGSAVLSWLLTPKLLKKAGVR